MRKLYEILPDMVKHLPTYVPVRRADGGDFYAVQWTYNRGDASTCAYIRCCPDTHWTDALTVEVGLNIWHESDGAIPVVNVTYGSGGHLNELPAMDCHRVFAACLEAAVNFAQLQLEPLIAQLSREAETPNQ